MTDALLASHSGRGGSAAQQKQKTCFLTCSHLATPACPNFGSGSCKQTSRNSSTGRRCRSVASQRIESDGKERWAYRVFRAVHVQPIGVEPLRANTLISTVRSTANAMRQEEKRMHAVRSTCGGSGHARVLCYLKELLRVTAEKGANNLQ